MYLPVSPLAPEHPSPLPPVPGFRVATVAAELHYKERDDLLLIAADPGTSVAGLLTTSAAPGHPVTWCREHLAAGKLRAVIVNAGNANVCNGDAGDRAVAIEVQHVAQSLRCSRDEVLVASTGVIGVPLPLAPIVDAVPTLVSGLKPDGWNAASKAIMTTDTFPKGASRRVHIDNREVTLTGIVKGSGMIHPEMATLLAFIATDANLDAPILDALLRDANARSFGSLTVDGDTSTSDTVLLMASRSAAHGAVAGSDDPRLGAFREALSDLCAELAQLVARDGEGAQKLVTIEVDGTKSDDEARQIARTVAASPLVKTAIAGNDANWGRVVMAVGRAGVPIDLNALSIRFGPVTVAAKGSVVPSFDEPAVTEHLSGREVAIRISVGPGPGRAVVWTCDLTHAYIDINADYRS